MQADSMIQIYQLFLVNKYWIIITICSLAIILWYYRKNKRILSLILLSILCFLCGVNSVTKVIIDKVYSSGGDSFYRLLWILPITFITVYAAILVVKILPKKWMGVLFTICIVAGLIKIAPLEEYKINGRLPENKYFVSDEGIELNTLMGDRECEEEKYYIGDVNVYLNLETYSDHFVFPFWRGCFINFEEWISGEDEDYRPLFESVLQGIPAYKNGRKQMMNALDKNNISYIIISKALFIENYYDKMGYHYLGETQNYIVYERND